MDAVFVTGGTGYVGRPLIAMLIARGHDVHALVRTGSEGRLPAGAHARHRRCAGRRFLRRRDPRRRHDRAPRRDAASGPFKAAEFERVDLASIRATVAAATQARAAHLVYVSVAQPAPVMHSYVAARAQGEAAVAATGLTATVVRPWYVLGPGHYWPYALVPLYALARTRPRVARSRPFVSAW